MPFSRIAEYLDYALFIAEYNMRGGVRMFRIAKSRLSRRPGFQTALSRRYNRTLHSYFKIWHRIPFWA